jgi:hydroxylamine reductase (hybrid-cluster protein)
MRMASAMVLIKTVFTMFKTRKLVMARTRRRSDKVKMVLKIMMMIMMMMMMTMMVVELVTT